MNGLEVDFRSGFGEAGPDVPDTLRRAAKDAGRYRYIGITHYTVPALDELAAILTRALPEIPDSPQPEIPLAAQSPADPADALTGYFRPVFPSGVPASGVPQESRGQSPL